MDAPRIPSRALRWTTLAAAAALLAAVAPAAAQEGIEHFHELGDFIVELDGADKPAAKVYAAKTPPAILLVTKELQTPVLLHPRSGQVQTVHLMKMVQAHDDSYDLLPGWALAELDPFEVTDQGTIVTFAVDGRTVRVKPRPALTGLQGTQSLRSYSPEYARKEADYQPSGPILDNLRKQERDVRVRVFFGTWCPYCGEMVPRAMRVAEELDGGKISFEFYGLPRDFSGDPQADKYDITGVPTGVVFVNGREVGRITGNSWKVPELALNKLLVGS